MATTMTLLNLRTAVRQRSDMVNDQFISDSELTSYINQSYFELYDILVQKYGDNYYVASPYSIATDGINQLYSLLLIFISCLGLILLLVTRLTLLSHSDRLIFLIGIVMLSLIFSHFMV